MAKPVQNLAPISEAVASVLCDLRTERGLTLAAVGSRLPRPAPAQHIHEYETGDRSVSLRRLAQLAEVLGTTPSEVLTRAEIWLDRRGQ